MKKPKFTPFLPMNLQMFASNDDQDPNDQSDNPGSNGDGEPGGQDSDPVDSEKIIEKLQKRLDSKTKAEKAIQSELKQALERIKELESGKKSVKDQADDDKIDAKDQRIRELEREIELKNITAEVDSVLKESGLALTSDELALVVDTNSDKAYAKVKTLLDLINKDRQQQAVARNTGTTPTRAQKQTQAQPSIEETVQKLNENRITN